MSINLSAQSSIGGQSQVDGPTKPSTPPPPPDTEAMQNEANSLKDQLQANPNDAEAKNSLAHLQREVENELKFEAAKGKDANPELVDKLGGILEGIEQTMEKHGVEKLPAGGNWQAGGS